MKMRALFFLFVSFLHILNLVCITSIRPFVPNVGHASHLGTEQSTQSLHTTLSLLDKVTLPSGGVGVEEKKEEERDLFKEVSRIGSSPPSCEHKCFGCMPCEAIQVPTTSSRVGMQYTNYEPEGWKCKCGPTFYIP